LEQSIGVAVGVGVARFVFVFIRAFALEFAAGSHPAHANAAIAIIIDKNLSFIYSLLVFSPCNK
jgi:hypothetical protein